MVLIKSVVFAIIPRSGLGNRLYVWARALIYSKTNSSNLVVIGWNKFQLGPWFRLEKNKRIYKNYFINNKTFKNYLVYSFVKLKERNNIDYNPSLSIKREAKKTIIFNSLSVGSFSDLSKYRQLIISTLNKTINPRLLSRLDEKYFPVIGVHIRRGDFRILTQGEDKTNLNGIRTPNEYFILVIKKIRETAGIDLKVSIFTDGFKHEISDILSLPNTELAPPNPDIIDLIYLSKSKIIITSAGSTFSYWAAFLSNAHVIYGSDQHQKAYRDIPNLFEGEISLSSNFPEKLINAIHLLSKSIGNIK